MKKNILPTWLAPAFLSQPLNSSRLFYQNNLVIACQSLILKGALLRNQSIKMQVYRIFHLPEYRCFRLDTPRKNI